MDGLGQFLGGLFGDSGSPYEDFMKQFQQYMEQAQQHHKPWEQAGLGALGDYQNNLQQYKDPQEYLKNVMGNYQMSPGARYEMGQGQRAFQNAGSAGGLSGSTALAKQAQQNSQGIAAGDQQQYLQNIMGIGNKYSSGLENLMSGGQNASNSLSNLLSQMAQGMGQGAYGQRAGQLYDRSQMLGGLFGNPLNGGGGQGQGGSNPFGGSKAGASSNQGGGGMDIGMLMQLLAFL